MRTPLTMTTDRLEAIRRGCAEWENRLEGVDTADPRYTLQARFTQAIRDLLIEVTAHLNCPSLESSR